MKKYGSRILAKDLFVDNDTRITGLNNNDLIVGPSGCGKTTGYVMPNLMQANESVIVTDTKGMLLHEVGPWMAKKGFQVLNIDFTEMGESAYGYDPLRHIRRGEKPGQYSEQDVMTVARSLCPAESSCDPFWDNAAAMVLACLIGATLESNFPKHQTMSTAVRLFESLCRQENGLDENGFGKLMQQLHKANPKSFAWHRYSMFAATSRAEKTHASILAVLSEKLDVMSFDGARSLFQNARQVDFARLAQEKTALFLTVSDADRSMDRLVSLFYLQALQVLSRYADRECPDHRLPVPVRLILDDFASGTPIPDFDNIISVIRSRDIYASVIVQSLSQLEGRYGHAKAMTIVNNCDNCLYLGGQDVETAQYFSQKMNRTVDTVLNLPLDTAILFTRGRQPRSVQKIGPTEWRVRRQSENTRMKGSSA
ncbi:MAG: type IV secretory system conjugative DNA transfer family protein [Subdoligranulum sp.]|nr:type IV secretory system conjugative DNA transfer family protein [Subdoligranulum sp.]